MNKFLRNYSLALTVQKDMNSTAETIIVELPFTVEFDITRNTLTSANVCQIRIYNLNPSHRSQIQKNVTSYGNAPPIITIALKAGYGDNLPVIFQGNASQAWSVRQGTNFITQIECFDGGFAYVNGATSLTVPQGTPYKTVITNLINSLFPNVVLGSVGDYSGSTPKQVTYSGNTIDILRELTGGGFFIDNGKGYALNNNEYSIAAGPPQTIDASSGLLNTPVLEQTIVRFDMIFEPSLNIGTGINLMSSTNATFNGFYKITSVKHRGMISQTVCGDAITTAEFFFIQNQTPVAGAQGGV